MKRYVIVVAAFCVLLLGFCNWRFTLLTVPTGAKRKYPLKVFPRPPVANRSLMATSAHPSFPAANEKESDRSRHPDLRRTPEAEQVTDGTPPQASQSPLILFVGEVWPFREQFRFNPFKKLRCPYSGCEVTQNLMLFNDAALIVFRGPWSNECCQIEANGDVMCAHPGRRGIVLHRPRLGQAYMLQQREPVSKTITRCLLPLDAIVNYTWTYKLDSDVPYIYGSVEKLRTPRKIDKDYFAGKTKDVLWYVGNCGSTVGALTRWRYATNLAKLIDVDIYGKCSKRSDGCEPNNNTCVSSIMEKYRFYLSFENSACKDYITEKFFKALFGGSVPIVRGLSKEQYDQLAPPKSFIHVDDFKTMEDLAAYLHYLSRNATAYNEYHAWRADYRPTGPDGHLCSLCQLASTLPAKTFRISDWWSSSRDCLE